MAQGAVSFSGMAEGIVGSYPPVFVVDSQARYIPLEGRKRWQWFSRKGLHVLVGLALLVMLLEAGCIIHLYSKTRGLVTFDYIQHNSGSVQGLTGSEENNEIPVETSRSPNPRETERKPTAHLTGSGLPVRNDGVIMWEMNDNSLSALRYKMNYKDGQLGVEQDGHYYVYSKVHFVEDCNLFKHQVLRMTQAYSKPLVLMKANRYHCPSQKSRLQNSQQNLHQNILNSYLGGVFHLSSGDKIYVTVENRTLLKAEDNFMGAFMI